MNGEHDDDLPIFQIMAEAEVTREWLGREVRRVWVGWAAQQPDPKPSWLQPYDELSPADQEADMRIGQVLFGIGWRAGQRAQQGGSGG